MKRKQYGTFTFSGVHNELAQNESKMISTMIYNIISFLRSSTISFIFVSFSGGFHLRVNLSRHIWPYMVSIAVTYYITLCLFPGIESEVVNCKLHEWMPIILMAVFNFTDLCGKVWGSYLYLFDICLNNNDMFSLH